MSEILLTVPEEALVALKLPLEAAGAELRLAAAAKLYELRRMSSTSSSSTTLWRADTRGCWVSGARAPLAS